MIVALAGGVGGAKLSQGIARAIDPHSLTVIVNTADDFDLWGLRICPDLDTVMYTLAGISDPVQGWGVAGDTTRTLQAIAAFGEAPWFRLGDRDVATHVLRTARLRAGEDLGSVTHGLAQALGIRSHILPMSNDPVSTIVHTDDGSLEFQEYFVARRQADDVIGLSYLGVEDAIAHPATIRALRDAETVVVCPSNPFVSVGPILAVPGMKRALDQSRAFKVAVSPIIGGNAVKGPAAKMMATLGHDVSALGIARLYAGLVDALVIDHADAALAAPIADLGLRVLVTQSVMGGPADRERFAREMLAWVDDIR